MTDPTPNYSVPPPPPTSPWTPQDPYAPYASHHPRSGEPPAGVPDPPPYQPYAGGPPEAGGPPDAAGPSDYQPYAGGPGYTGPAYGSPYGPAPPGTRKPPAYWPLSIVGVLFSFLFGAIAVYFSVQVGRRWNRGDVDGAGRASRTARNLGIIAIIVGVIGTAILLGADSR
jgi:interferon-induced transmembrane protein